MDQISTPLQQAKSKKVIIILSILLSLVVALVLVIGGFIAGALFVRWQDANTDWDLMGRGNIQEIDNNPDAYCPDCAQALKPAIYLYPTTTTQATVQLNYDGVITTDIPKYDPSLRGWQVTAQPDGTLSAQDGNSYPYIFWEGKPNNPNRYDDPEAGFVVTASEAEQFLQSTLPKLGLTETEYEEFIEFWLPRLQQNPYNLVHFAGAEYLDEAKLTVEPTPDSAIRVFMVMQPLDQPITIEPQQLTTPSRTGFTVVEWGGTILAKE